MILVELDDKLLEGLDHRILDIIELKEIYLVVALVVLLWERKDLLEELTDLLEVFCAEFLLHSHNNWLKELAIISKRDI